MGPNASVNHPPRYFQPRQQQSYQSQQSSGPTLDEIVKTLASSTLQFQQETRTSIKNLETQVSQLASSVGRMEAQGSSKLPSQTVTNRKESVNAITLRGGKQLEDVHRKVASEKEEDKVKCDLPGVLDEANPQIEVGEPPKKMSRTEEQPIVSTLPFPSQFSKSKKEESEKEV